MDWYETDTLWIVNDALQSFIMTSKFLKFVIGPM